MKVLTMQITIEKMVSESCPELKYSIDGAVSEQGHYFGFGCPLTQKEFAQENLNKIIERNCQSLVWGCSEQEIRIIPKIIEDCRVTQLTLF